VTTPQIYNFPGTDTITLAGVQPVGKWTYIEGPRVFGWEERKGYGLTGATTVPTGDELVKPRFLWEVFNNLDFIAAKLFRSTYLKKPAAAIPGSPAPMAMGIYHPELKELGVESVVVKEVSPFVNDGFGLWSCTVLFWQYRKPLPALSKPLASIPDVATPRPTAQDEQDRQLQLLQAQLQQVAK